VVNFYNNKINNYQQQQNMAVEKNLYLLALGLPPDEEESKAEDEIQTLVNEKKMLVAFLQAQDAEITALKAKLQTFETAKVTNLINQAVADKKIGEDERETYTALAEKDFCSVEKIINKMFNIEPIFKQNN
jgi:hypothetical protein